MEKDIRFSIDKLTVLGKFKEPCMLPSFKSVCDEIDLFFRRYIENEFYTYSYKIKDLGFLQFDSVTYKFRLEFNPNKLTDYSSKLLPIILSYFTDFHFSRIDLAIDLFNYNLYNYNIVDLNSRKKAYYYDRVGKLETVYFGSMSSNRFIRIYNKAVEQKVKDLDWWRVELQLRDDYIDTYLTGFKDLLSGVFIFKYVTISSLSFQERAIVEYLLHDITRLSELSKNVRSKYRKILSELNTESLSFINDLMQSSYNYVLEYLHKLCPCFYS